MSPEDKLARARVVVSRDAPYISSILYGLVPVPLPGLGTMLTTEHMVLMYDPAWIFTVDNPGEETVLAGVIMHECMHVLRKHIERFGNILLGDEKYIANVAMDIAINPDLIAAGWKLTPDALMPSRYNLPDGQTAEWYFSELRKQKAQKQSSKKGGQEGQGEGSGDADNNDGPNDGSPSGGGQGQGNSKPGVCSGCCGSVTGNKSPHADKEQKVDAEVGRTESDQSRLIKAAAEAIKKYAQEGRGRMPASLKEIVKRLDEPAKVDWRNALGQVIRKATGRIKGGGKDFSLRRPSKRSYARGLIRPGLIQQVPEVCIVRDTSGSMGSQQINDATRESIGIFQALGLDLIWYIDADAEVAFKKRIRLPELKELPVHGRGGTDFRPAIYEAEKLKPRPDLLVYVTDGDGYAPANPPRDMEFIWCVVPSYYKRRPAKWGHLVVVSEDSIELGEPMGEE
jgi:predicted metal-dependent peptidase